MDTQPQAPADNTPRLFTVTEWTKTHTWPPTGGIRYLIFNAASNGFDKVIRRCGRRILIHEAEFYKWLDAQNGKAAVQ